MPKLVIALEGVVLKEVLLAKERTTVGRRPYNDIVIDNLAVSGEHAALHMIGGEVYLEDLESTNGTYVNSRPIRRQVLANNDVIDIGKYKVRFVAHDDGTAVESQVRISPSPAPAPPPAFGGPTAPMPLGGGSGPAVMRVLSGNEAGQELPLIKVVTTLGKPGIAVAAVTHRRQGYVVAPVDGVSMLNGEALGGGAVPLNDGDVLELGGVRMQFVQG